MQHYNVVMIGKTGHGKSSTGNTLLAREAFVVSDSSDSVTSAVQTSTSTTSSGVTLTVVDGPGLGDTRMDTEQAIRKACTDTETGIKQCQGGVSAFLLVLKYGNRYTQEEQTTVSDLKSILGPDVVKNHVILAFTHGEVFDMKQQTTGLTFTDWSSQQTGQLQSLMAECGNRCVLFYNADPNKMAAPVDEVLSHAKKTGCYTHAMFLSHSHSHKQLIVRSTAPHLRAALDSSISSIRSRLSSITSSTAGFDDKLSQLASLAGQVRQLSQQAQSDDLGTGVLTSQMTSLATLKDDVTSQQTAVSQQKTAEEKRREAERIEAERQRVEAEAERARRHRKRRRRFLFF